MIRALALRASFCALAASTYAAERLPIEIFARTPDTSEASLSPDGKFLAFLREYNGHACLHVADIATQKVVRLDFGPALLINGATKDVYSFAWVSDHRLMATTMVWDMIYGVVAADSDGKHPIAISGFENNTYDPQNPTIFAHEIIYRSYDAAGHVLMLDRHEHPDRPGSRNRPDVLTVDSTTGLSSTLIENFSEVATWAADSKGVVRLGIMSHGDLSGAIYRDSESSPWRTILPLKDRNGGLDPVGFDAVNNRVMLACLTEQKRWTLFGMNPANGELGEALLADPVYDILPQHFVPEIEGHSLCTPIFSFRKDALLGVRYVTDAPRVKWFDRDLARMQAAVDRAAKDTVNILVDLSANGKRALWFSYSDQNPGQYFLVDTEKKSFNLLTQCCPWIKPEQMAPMLAVKYQARDGLLIHGFLTVPKGHQPKSLPLVVMPHGGPWVRDVWGYDPMVQLLASRGYAVLQMNYRGSPGYGEELYANAKRQIGGQIQSDIEDATQWAIAAGVADPKRIAICGGSYGGYSTLFALGKSPGLYRCGISIAGVTDWPAMFQSSDVAAYKEATKYWREQIGDPKNDAAFLASISPINFAEAIKAPVLIIQGKEDRRVPPDQAKRMIAALEKKGNKPETLFLANTGHNLHSQRARQDTFQAMVTFLEKNLGPGVE